MIRPDKQQRDRARNLRKNLTDAERLLWQGLRGKQLGAKFRRQAPLGSYIMDFLSHDAHLVIELDGGHPGESVALDENRTAFIKEQGFAILRFLNNQVFENIEEVLQVISDAISDHLQSDPPHPTLPRKRGRALASSTTTTPLIASTVQRGPNRGSASAQITLTYNDRFLRRKLLTTAQGDGFLVDLPQATSLNHGDMFELPDGRLIEIIAAPEDLLQITGDNLISLAWHIGNRHTPCQIEPTRLLIQRDPVLRDMLAQLGATIHDIREAFTPEGGAYGFGRTHGHSH